MNDLKLLELRTKLIAKLGFGCPVHDALEVIAEHFGLPTEYVPCTECSGKGRVPYKKGSVPCPRCYTTGRMKITTWMDSK